MFGMSTTSPMLPPFGEPDTREREPGDNSSRVCILGSRESGKTCFLGGIALLDKQVGWNIRADGRSMARLDQFVAALSAIGSWLPGTQDTERYVLTVSHGRDSFSFDVFDYPGQNFHRVIRSFTPEHDPNLYQQFIDADYLLLLVDPTDDPANTTNRAALIDSVKHRFLGGFSGKLPQVAVILTKADEISSSVSDSASAAAFINQRYPDFLPKLQSMVGKVQVFPISAVGAVDANGRPATATGPTGYESLFKWMTVKPTVRAAKTPTSLPRWPAYLAGIAAVAFAAWVLPDYLFSRATAATLNDSTASITDRLDQTRDHHGWFGPSINADRERLAKDELARLESAVKETSDAAALRRVAEEARSIKAVAPVSVQSAILACGNSAKCKAASLTFETLQRLKATNDPAWSERAQLFMERYPDDAKSAVVYDWFAAGRTDAQKAARKKLAEYEVDDPASSLAKSDAMRRYLAEFGKHESQREKYRIGRAVEMAELIARKRDWDIHFVSVGELKNARPMTLKVLNADNDSVMVEFDRATRIANSDQTRCIDWKPGQTLRVQLFVNDSFMPFGTSEALAASMAVDNPMAIVSLFDANEGSLELKADPKWKDQFNGPPMVRFRVGNLQPDDIRIVKEYLYPGTRWQ